jgi:hypothetical protein
VPLTSAETLETRTIDQRRDGGSRQPERPRQVHVERLLPALVVDVRCGATEPQSGVRDDDVEPSERVPRRGDGRPDVIVVGRIPGDGPPVDLGRDGLEGFGAAAGDDHLRALPREDASGRGTDPRSAAAHDRHLVFEPHRSPLSDAG